MSALPEPVLVTGATGFIGRHLVRRLLDDGVDPIAFDLPDAPVPASWGGRVGVTPGDITDAARVREVVRGGTVIHLAAVVGDWGDEAVFRAVTVEGSRHVFEAAVATGARVALASSIVVYGDRIGAQACDEDTPFGRALGPYSRCKQRQEQLAWDYHRDRDMALTVVRPANVYGPGCKPWVHDIIDVLRSGAPCLLGGGDFDAGLVYVDNLIDVLLAAAASERALGRVYNACDGSITWARYISDLAQIAGTRPPRSAPLWLARAAAPVLESLWRLGRVKRRPLLTREAVNLVGSAHRIQTRRAADELGWTPRIGYEQAMGAIAASLRDRDGAA
jgi:nucleoside-diphosphate-sugar epimerase